MTPSNSSLNVVFVNYHDFTSNSAIHIFHLANALVEHGAECTVCIPGDPATVTAVGIPRFRVVDFAEARRGGIEFRDDSSPTLIHAWTPRESVRELTLDIAAVRGWPYVVHLEDHEDAITAETFGVSLEDLAAMPIADLDARVGPNLTHPTRGRAFMSESAGVTVILDRLLEIVPPDTESEVIWPAFEEELFKPQEPDAELRRELGLKPHERVVVYAGNAHAANAAELRSLYLAVHIVNGRGYPTRLVRLGRDFVDFLGTELRALDELVLHVGFRPRPELPRYLALADILVQPGRSSPFNDYRFPAKLPEYLAMGKPVVLPATNIGRFLEDGEECLLLQHGHSVEIADAMERVFEDCKLGVRIGRNGRAFAEEQFSWQASASRLRGFYDRVTRRLISPDHGAVLDRIGQRYTEFDPPPLGYATVRDYCDSADHLPFLASANRDMKDVQRSWMLKAILGRVERGGRLLEIGAGDPIVAGLLSRLGYEVWVIDPYDARDGGPADFDQIRPRYPALHFVRNTFPDGMDAGEAGSFDCIYSISVLEHIPDDAVGRVCVGIRRFSHAGAWSIHAVDHVVLGNGAAEHHAKLVRFADEFGIKERVLTELFDELERDPDAYFLSAEGHNRWRGSTPYDEFPMRRCVSVQFCVTSQSDS